MSDPNVMDHDGSVRFDKPLKPAEPAPSTECKKQSSCENQPPVSTYISRKFYTGPIIDFIYNRVFIRNSKESISRDFDVPQVRHIYCILTGIWTCDVMLNFAA